MKIVELAPLTVTVTLELTECIALYDACEQRSDPLDLQRALGAALLAATLAAADPHMDEAPPTIAKVWRVWAPVVFLGGEHRYGRLPVPPEYAD